MTQLLIALPLSLVLFALLLWLMRVQGRTRRSGTPRSPLDQEAMGLLPHHYRYFPQIQQALSGTDERYLRETAPLKLAQKVRRERRVVAKQFLAGLREDFMNLHRLGRIIASLSPVISREQETERFVLSLEFRLRYAWVWLRLSAGDVSLPQIENLAGLVGQLSARLEQAMAKISALSAQELNQGVNA